MAITSQPSADGQELTIVIQGRFDFGAHQAGGDHAQIRLLNCNPDVRKILAISNFEQLFKIA